MSVTMSVKDSLVRMRQIISDERDRSERIHALFCELTDLISGQVSASTELEVAIDSLIAALGFEEFHSSQSGHLPYDETCLLYDGTQNDESQPTTKKQKSSPAKTSSVEATDVIVNVDLSTLENKMLEVLRSRYPLFTTADQFRKYGVVKKSDSAGPTITRLRRKGVAIESAQQARENDHLLSEDIHGWRLIRV